MPNDFQFKAANALHKAVVTLSFGKLGWRGANMPVLELTTVGRKSGQKHAVMLTSPLQEGSTIVIVASAGGEDKNPAWLLNLRDNPDVEVRMQGGPKRRMKAHVADADERARLWPKVTAGYKNYADYQTKTSRQIPLVLLDPVT
jgi:deazaflavin-dependent oxidoreductase (nitroreductase family)